MNEESDRYFAEFLQFGGETGYTAMFNIDHYKKMMADYQKNNGEEKSIAIARWMRNANRWAEDKTRFAAYVNERKHGKTVVEAIKVAKECSVNFNRKGSGKMGNTSARVIWLFLNAGIQGMSNFYKRFKANPVKTSTTVLGKWIAMGAITPWLNSMIMGLFGKDDDDYWNLTDYQRKNNICIFIPYTEKSFAMIPIPIELRAFYGMGESMHGHFSGREDGRNTSISIAKGLSDLFPINPTEGGSGLIPASVKPFWEIYTNENFTGIPIVNENIDKNAPEYKRVYSNTNKGLVEASKALNNISGGDVATPGIFNINPAVIEHLFDGYFGGVSMTASQAVKTAMMPFGLQEGEVAHLRIHLERRGAGARRRGH